VFWRGGFREAQIIAVVIMALSFYWMRRWMGLAIMPNGDSNPTDTEVT
jgi:hypothetical protein